MVLIIGMYMDNGLNSVLIPVHEHESTVSSIYHVCRFIVSLRCLTLYSCSLDVSVNMVVALPIDIKLRRTRITTSITTMPVSRYRLIDSVIRVAASN